MLFTSDAVASLWARHENLQREARLVEAARRARESLQQQTTAVWEAAWVSFSESWGDESIHDDFAATDNEQRSMRRRWRRRRWRRRPRDLPANAKNRWRWLMKASRLQSASTVAQRGVSSQRAGSCTLIRSQSGCKALWLTI